MLLALVGALRSSRFAALVEALDAVKSSPPDGWPANAADWGAAAIRRAARRVGRWQAAAGEPTGAELHRLRIAFKRFRYTCEFFADALGDEVREAIRELVRFQDILGAHQDAVVALHRLDGLVGAAARSGARPALLVALGALQQVQREEAIGRRDAFAKAWPRLPKRLRRLRRGLRRRPGGKERDGDGSQTPTVLFIGIAGTVVAIDRSTGTELWRRRLKGTASFTTVLFEDGVLFAGTGGELYRLDPATGEVLWHNRLKGLGMGLVAFASGPSVAAAVAAQQATEAAAAAAATTAAAT